MNFRINLILITSLWSQEIVGSWSSFGSFHTIKECNSSIEDQIICLTNGGIIIFDLENNSSEIISVNDGLSKSNYYHIEIDNYRNIWISCNYNEKNIDIWSYSKEKIINRFIYDVDEITRIESDSLNSFALYRHDNDIGLMHFIMVGQVWKYFDYYIQFGEEIVEIYDIKILNESILLSTNVGIIKGELSDNLKNASSWNLIVSNIDHINFVNSEQLEWFTQGSLFQYDDNSVVQIDLGINNIIDLIHFENYYILTENSFYINNSNSNIFEYSNPFSSKYIDINKFGKQIFISVENHGILLFNEDNLDNPTFYPLPSTMLNDEFTAITILENSNMVGIGIYGTSMYNGYEWSNFIPQSTGFEFDQTIFNNEILNYRLSNGGDGSIFPSWSIIEPNQNSIMFGNTQIKPNNPGYAGALIEFNFDNSNLSVYDTTKNVLDGMDGIFNEDWDSKNLIVNQIKKDPDGNIWVLNPYAEGDSNIIAIRPKNSENWVHIKAKDGNSFLPTELEFDNQGRVWVAFEDRTSMENTSYSSGGLKVILLVGDFDGDFNYYWREIDNPNILPDNSIWSIAIDKQDFIWVLTSSGIQGYSTQLNGLTLSPIYLIDFYSYLPLFRGDHIRVDNQDNKWITTRHSGVKVILESTQYWPTVDGFTYENSGLLSNVVNDLAFDEKNGFIWFATELGVSRLDYPITTINLNASNLLFHPNPFYPNLNEQLIIEGCYPNGTLQIIDINGNFIKSINANFLGEGSTQILWQGMDQNGKIVDSGIYLVSSRSENGKVKRGKLAVIRQ